MREKVGFQDLLYGTGKDLSALFISLIQLVPKEGEDEHEEEISERLHIITNIFILLLFVLVVIFY